MEELDISLVVKRSIHGVIALVSRTLFIQIVTVIVNFLLTIFLSPSVFGVYFLVSAVIAFLSYFSDIGLAAALIQKREKLTRDDLKTTFTIQQVLVILIVVIALLVVPWIKNFYHLDVLGLQLFIALIISFFLSSLKTIPSILLERELKFEKLVILQIVETLVFNIVALFCAIKGLGVASFSIAVLFRGLSGLIAIYIVSPWRIEFGLSGSVARKLLGFGIPFQTNSILGLIKDDLLIAYAGKVLPIVQVGYIGFAQKWAYAPLRLIMDNIIRITFPSFSRLQDDKTHLSKAIEKSLFVLALTIFPSVVGLMLVFPYLTHIIPKYQKWEPALISLGFFALNAGLSSVSTPLTNALNAIGKIKISLYLMVFWTSATWILTPLFILWFGFNGFAGASALIALSVFGVVYLTKRCISFSSIHSVRFPFLASCIMGFVLIMFNKIVSVNLINFFIAIALGVITYIGAIYLLAWKEVKEDIRTIREQLIRK